MAISKPVRICNNNVRHEHESMAMDAQPESAASAGVPVTTPEFAIQPNYSHHHHSTMWSSAATIRSGSYCCGPLGSTHHCQWTRACRACTAGLVIQ